MPQVRLITINGETNTIAHWCRVYGISRSVVANRILSGMSITEALTTPAHHVILTFNGVTKCQHHWAKELGISSTNLSKRLKRLSVAEALTMPKRKRTHRQ